MSFSLFFPFTFNILQKWSTRRWWCLSRSWDKSAPEYLAWLKTFRARWRPTDCPDLSGDSVSFFPQRRQVINANPQVAKNNTPLVPTEWTSAGRWVLGHLSDPWTWPLVDQLSGDGLFVSIFIRSYRFIDGYTSNCLRWCVGTETSPAGRATVHASLFAACSNRQLLTSWRHGSSTLRNISSNNVLRQVRSIDIGEDDATKSFASISPRNLNGKRIAKSSFFSCFRYRLFLGLRNHSRILFDVCVCVVLLLTDQTERSINYLGDGKTRICVLLSQHFGKRIRSLFFVLLLNRVPSSKKCF